MSQPKLTSEEGRMLIYGDLEGWETVESKVVDTSRWSIISEGVFKDIASGKYYGTHWSEGATEHQDECAFEYEEPELHEVEPVEVTTTSWRKINE